ncbi:SDR family NAD(P)-dependent oxidoreductase [Acidithiobacillus sp. CV18-2]|uniref:SDR family NAD(P)-dependent oxidoreductase n=1 Tax=Igneacidithiobacillus copahuensis TaxID=2724909 RepID=A0AAE2YQJ5_9PROT|nr:SDR family NAD(P)-dependent oxidoreductase [Igneacidithiobacillus copahuensis]MBU2755452.1 SDR family NAD(P)-dependent oxidoreductase [Acidithiobacillus sp. CV18-3]MBU2757902.1 SDR family NAD(P)-dependent oxidoreductase [Acidithiobacillus sp. BN09-2]MBU2778178.1 SDR family NAD(P)-dependent oxidoreductase [Acidithiobacillus sp. CV18-2]MBU2797001.1 SDR family NAD(P)-dependent oxidoreductase [Acidithiobacillus sp. VAN18-2]MBU2800531.1 SDR family NAD(P)-dependent oxidoreductase [Acidithiobacill
MNKGYWHGKRCWLIGASSGIGAATAQALHAAGARVAITARSADKLQQVLPNGENALLLPADVREAASLEEAHAQILRHWQGLDLLLYLAGAYAPARSWELDLQQAESILDVNYRGALRTLAAALPGWEARGPGKIVLVSSIAALRGLPQSLYYGPSKAALTHLAEVLRLDLEPRGFGVQVAHPGFVATPLTAQNDFAMPHLLQPEEAAQTLLKGMQSQRFAIEFPPAFTRRFHVLRCLPYRWYFPLIRRATGL